MPKADDSVRSAFNAGSKQLLIFLSQMLFDTAKGTFLFLALLWFSWLFSLGKAFGIKQEYIDAFEQLHFWADYGVFFAIGLSFFVRALKGVFRE